LDGLAQKPSPDLHVFCFGKFRLFKGNEEITAERWKSENAKMLFKYMVLMNNRGYLSKDVLLELVWPGQDPALTNNRLHVALSTIRKLLEPELPRGKQSSYLLRKGNAYKLSLGAEGSTDIELFDRAAGMAKKAMDKTELFERCLEAEKIYQGDLFEEDRYVQWCMDARDEYKEKYLTLLSHLISWYGDRNDNTERIKYLKKYLEHDEYAETMYQLLMKSYGQAGERSMVIKTFERCRQKIEVELDCPLQKDTLEIYAQTQTTS
jgi:DNA-binding SARP family transcriptional activator